MPCGIYVLRKFRDTVISREIICSSINFIDLQKGE